MLRLSLCPASAGRPRGLSGLRTRLLAASAPEICRQDQTQPTRLRTQIPTQQPTPPWQPGQACAIVARGGSPPPPAPAAGAANTTHRMAECQPHLRREARMIRLARTPDLDGAYAPNATTASSSAINPAVMAHHVAQPLRQRACATSGHPCGAPQLSALPAFASDSFVLAMSP
jgi:hypothetical protein